MAYHPQEDQYLVVQLPGERLRALIRRVVTDDAVIVEITSVPLAKSHTYKRGDIVACRRDSTDFGDVWESVPDQRISIDKVAETIAPPKKKKQVKKKVAKDAHKKRK